MKKVVINILFLFFVFFFCNAQNNNKPNIIYINVDDLGWMDTGTYGSTFYETPNIDKLALQGKKLHNGSIGLYLFAFVIGFCIILACVFL